VSPQIQPVIPNFRYKRDSEESYFMNQITNEITLEKLLLLMCEYFKEYKPKVWLFEGGTDLISIKELLRHNSLATTSIYTHACLPAGRQVSKKHIAKVQSPLDKLGL